MDNEDYNIGYGRPPKATQFQKGQSGNPQGRPPQNNQKVYLNDVIRAELNEYIDVRIEGEMVSIPKLNAVIKVMVGKALKGDIKAVKFLSEYLPRRHEIIELTRRHAPHFSWRDMPPPDIPGLRSENPEVIPPGS